MNAIYYICNIIMKMFTKIHLDIKHYFTYTDIEEYNQIIYTYI